MFHLGFFGESVDVQTSDSRANWLLFLSDIRGRMWMGNLRLACNSGSNRRPDRDPRNLNKDKAEAANKEEKVFVFYRQQSDACRRVSVLFASNFHKTRRVLYVSLYVYGYFRIPYSTCETVDVQVSSRSTGEISEFAESSLAESSDPNPFRYHIGRPINNR